MAEPSTAVAAHWFVEDVDAYAGAWKPLWKCDSDRLEHLHTAGARGEQVPVYCTRALVDLDQRTSVTTYYESPPVKIRRGTWFYKDRKGNFVPYEEELAQALEDWTQQLLHDRRQLPRAQGKASTASGEASAAESANDFQVQKSFEEHKLTFVAQRVDMPVKGLNQLFQSNTQPVVEDILIYEYTNWTANLQLPSMGSSKGLSLPSVGTSTPIKRGYRHTPVEGEELSELEAGHLLLVVHGIGEAFFSREDSPLPSFRVSVRDLRSNILEGQIKLRDAAKAAGNDDLANKPIRRIEALPIEWYDAVHGPENDLTKKLSMVTLPSLTMVRSFGNEAVADVMLYCNPAYQQKILDKVVERMNFVYLKYLELNPSFSGRVSVVGHSLGSIITFDILSHQQPSASPMHPRADTHLREGASPSSASTGMVQVNSTVQPLAFEPEVYFAWGSPTALFLSIRGTELTNFRLPTCRRMYNMFKPHDVIAYRVEPLQDEALAREAPAAVPHSVDAYRPLLERPDNTSWTAIMKKVAGISEARLALLASETPDKFPALQLNEGARVDWALPVGTFEHEYVSAVSSHTGYFADADVALFLATHLQVHDDVKAIALVGLDLSDGSASQK